MEYKFRYQIKHKFRGKRIDNEKWVFGNVINCASEEKTYIFPSDNCANESLKIDEGGCLRLVAIEVDPETVGQFIGLKDKNGEEIYEGDIVLCENETLGVVRYDEFEALYDVGKSPVHYYVYNTRNPEFMKVYIEIMGNIYDNPEILESESDE